MNIVYLAKQLAGLDHEQRLQLNDALRGYFSEPADHSNGVSLDPGLSRFLFHPDHANEAEREVERYAECLHSWYCVTGGEGGAWSVVLPPDSDELEVVKSRNQHQLFRFTFADPLTAAMWARMVAPLFHATFKPKVFELVQTDGLL